MMTLISLGGFLPIEIASRRMAQPSNSSSGCLPDSGRAAQGDAVSPPLILWAKAAVKVERRSRGPDMISGNVTIAPSVEGEDDRRRHHGRKLVEFGQHERPRAGWHGRKQNGHGGERRRDRECRREPERQRRLQEQLDGREPDRGAHLRRCNRSRLGEEEADHDQRQRARRPAEQSEGSCRPPPAARARSPRRARRAPAR